MTLEYLKQDGDPNLTKSHLADHTYLLQNLEVLSHFKKTFPRIVRRASVHLYGCVVFRAADVGASIGQAPMHGWQSSIISPANEEHGSCP